jgi:hypothetical protein
MCLVTRHFDLQPCIGRGVANDLERGDSSRWMLLRLRVASCQTWAGSMDGGVEYEALKDKQQQSMHHTLLMAIFDYIKAILLIIQTLLPG